jgi:hypothetical protein
VLWCSPLTRSQNACPSLLALRSFGPVQVEPRLHLLPVGRAGGGALGGLPTQLACSPLPLSLVAHMMRPPRHGVPTAKEFYRTWSVLPARLEVSGEYGWAGQPHWCFSIGCTSPGLLRAPTMACPLASVNAPLMSLMLTRVWSIQHPLTAKSLTCPSIALWFSEL